MTPLLVVTSRQADADIEAAIDYYLNQGASESTLGFPEIPQATKILLS